MGKFIDNFQQNVAVLQQLFDKEDTFRVRYVKNQHHPEVPIAVFFFDCMVNSDLLNRDIAGPLVTVPFDASADDLIEEISQSVLFASSQDFTDDVQTASVQLAAGDSLVLAGDCPRAVILDIKGMAQRGIEQPDGEVSIAGPHEGFDENIMHNLSLVKKRLCSSHLKAEFIKVGKQSATNVAVCYMDNIADPKLVERVKKKLKSISMDGVWDGNFLLEMMQAKNTLLFPLIGRTQRPDVVCSKVCEGRVALIVNGAPSALTLPFLFTENFQTADDYYLSHPYGNVGRSLRIIGFFLSFLVPALYIALLLHHPQMLPSELLFSIASAQRGVPISSLLEMLSLFLVFEALRETGSRMPEAVGLALNIVGAIVLGQSAVEAGFVSAAMVIVIAFSGTVGLMVRELRGSVFFLRLGFILMGAWLGLFGVAALTAVLWCYLHSLKTQGLEYMYTFDPFYRHVSQDAFLRGKIPFMNFRQNKMTKNTKRQGKV